MEKTKQATLFRALTSARRLSDNRGTHWHNHVTPAIESIMVNLAARGFIVSISDGKITEKYAPNNEEVNYSSSLPDE